eukprot:GHVT01067477.1.p3 GENE.GHVT01067477.1~~GHVT01067477.1.p3  ORF type:complete len:131 (-),score=9.18 GHVT01067477.1:1712-2104(-)
MRQQSSTIIASTFFKIWGLLKFGVFVFRRGSGATIARRNTRRSKYLTAWDVGGPAPHIWWATGELEPSCRDCVIQAIRRSGAASHPSTSFPVYPQDVGLAPKPATLRPLKKMSVGERNLALETKPSASSY